MHAEAQSADLDTFLISVLQETFAYWIMLNTEVLWNKALTDNSVRDITRWLRSLTTEGKSQQDMDKSLAKFNCWLQCSIELTKKELLALCFGQCHGLWMFLDQTSCTKLCLLIQKLKNLLLLVRWEHTCVMCQVNIKAMARCECWNLDLYTLRQHILLGRLVQWWSFSGLLPQYPEANELKQISQMWQEMSQHQRTTCLELCCDIEDEYRGNSIIQGMVAHMHKHGQLWISEDCTYQIYPPPSLHSLLKIVLVPYTDATSALAVIMYFVLDVSSMQGKGDLLESFCHTFRVPSSFSQQVYGLWLLDHGFVSNSLEKLLSPETSTARLSCHSYAVLRTLLRQGQRQAALKYLYYSKPAIESTQDARLYMDVLLQNNHVAEAQILLRRCQPGNKYLLEHFICCCENLDLCGGALASVYKDILHLKLSEGQNSSKSDSMNQIILGDKFENKLVVKGHAPSPLSALLYQCLFNGSLTPGDVLRLFREAVTELNSSNKCTRMMVVWPKYLEKTKENRNISHSPETFCQSPCFLTSVELQKEQPEMELLQNDRMKIHLSPACASSGFTSLDSMESACSLTCSPSPPPAERRQEEARNEECDSLSDNHIPSKAVTQCCSTITLTVKDAPMAMLMKSLSREDVVEDVLTGTIPGNLLDPAESHMVDVTQTDDSNKDKQTVLHCAAMIPVDGGNFFMPDFEKMTDDMAKEPYESNKGEDESEQFSVLFSERVYCQDSICDEASGSSSFLDLKPLRRALPYPPLEKNLRSFCYDPLETMDQPEILTSCAVTETMQDLLGQFHEQNFTLKDGENIEPSCLVSVRNSVLVMDLNPLRRGSRPNQLQSSLRAPLLPLSPPEKTKDKAVCEGKNAGTKEVVCFRTTSDRVGDCKLGSWWKQALETRRASTGLLPAIEQIPAVTKEKRHSLVIGWPQSHGLIRAQKNEVKQATKEESSSRTAKGKLGKRVKQS